MHLFSKAIGLGGITARPAMITLLNEMIRDAVDKNRVIYNPHEVNPQGGLFEAQINRGLLKNIADSDNYCGGIAIRGLYNPADKSFTLTYYFPYIHGRIAKFNNDLMIERQSDKEAYMVHCNEPKREISPIFFMKNVIEYLTKSRGITKLEDKFVYLSALSVEGKVIMPVKKTDDQIQKCKLARNERNELVDKALKGDQEAIDNLTIEDYDTISNLCQRIRTEDVYSIVDSAFIPSGLECDMYAVVGNIHSVEYLKNEITGEDIYYLGLECNDVLFELAINKSDIFGMPQIGCRFVGKVWLQGDLRYDN